MMLFNTFLVLLNLYIFAVGLLFIFQRQLIYHPDKGMESPARYGLDGFSEHFIASIDEVVIQVWYRPASSGFPTIVYYHGNAGNLANRVGIYTALAVKGFGVLALSYRGYGKSAGHPNEQGLYLDARAAIDFLTEKKHIPLQQIMLFGESLGTGVAVQMATEYNVGALILQSPYISVAHRAAELYYYIPVRLLIHDHFDSLAKIAKVKAPLLLFHGQRDNIIPVMHGQKVFDAATSPKQAFFFPDVSHNDFDSDNISAHVSDFAKVHNLIAH